jgi:hypothetical protein
LVRLGLLGPFATLILKGQETGDNVDRKDGYLHFFLLRISNLSFVGNGGGYK